MLWVFLAIVLFVGGAGYLFWRRQRWLDAGEEADLYSLLLDEPLPSALRNELDRMHDLLFSCANRDSSSLMPFARDLAELRERLEDAAGRSVAQVDQDALLGTMRSLCKRIEEACGVPETPGELRMLLAALETPLPQAFWQEQEALAALLTAWRNEDSRALKPYDSDFSSLRLGFEALRAATTEGRRMEAEERLLPAMRALRQTLFADLGPPQLEVHRTLYASLAKRLDASNRDDPL